MKALVYTEPYKFEYTDSADPQIGDDDVLIRVKASGICGSDIKGATGETGRRLPPLIMGHEAAGVIEAVGKNAEGFREGERVCFDSTVYCNKCEECLSGFYNRCESREVLGVSTASFKRDGAFAEYVAVPWWIVSKIPDEMGFTHAAMLEPVSIGVHAVNRSPVSEDDTVVVIGAGTIGLFVVQACKLKGAGRIIACDIDEYRLGVAERLGADEVINCGECDLKEAVLDATDGKGAGVVFEVVGYASTFQGGVSVTKTGGCLIAVGNVEKSVTFDLQEFIASELTFRGSYASSGEFGDCIELVASGKINVEPLISDVVALSEGARAFDRLLKGEDDLLKIIMEP